MKKNKQLLSEVRRMQQLAGIRPLNEFEDLNGEFEDLNGDRLYDKPNLDVGKIGVYEAELEDMFMQYAEQYGESDALEGSEADHLPMLEDELGRKLPLIFTFVIQGDNSDKDSVYDLGDGENVIYEEGYDGMIQAYSKKTLAKVIRELKRMGAKPYQEGMEEASGMDMDQAVAEGMGESYAAMSQDRGDTGSSIEFEVINDMGDKAEIHYVITPNSQARSRVSARGLGARGPQEGQTVVAKQDWIDVAGTSFGPIKWR